MTNNLPLLRAELKKLRKQLEILEKNNRQGSNLNAINSILKRISNIESEITKTKIEFANECGLIPVTKQSETDERRIETENSVNNNQENRQKLEKLEEFIFRESMSLPRTPPKKPNDTIVDINDTITDLPSSTSVIDISKLPNVPSTTVSVAGTNTTNITASYKEPMQSTKILGESTSQTEEDRRRMSEFFSNAEKGATSGAIPKRNLNSILEEDSNNLSTPDAKRFANYVPTPARDLDRIQFYANISKNNEFRNTSASKSNWEYSQNNLDFPRPTLDLGGARNNSETRVGPVGNSSAQQPNMPSKSKVGFNIQNEEHHYYNDRYMPGNDGRCQSNDDGAPRIREIMHDRSDNPLINSRLSEPRVSNQFQRTPSTRPRDSFLRRLRLIPKCDGSALKELRDFIEISEPLFYSSVNESEENEFYEQMYLQLRGEARRVVLELEDTTWESVKSKLLSYFSYLSNKDILNCQIENLRQEKDESLTKYSERVRKLLQEKNSLYGYLTEEQKKEHGRMARRAFSNGISDSKLRDRLKTRGASSLEDAIAYAIELESDNLQEIPRKEQFCGHCNTNGHREKDCRRKNEGNSDINKLITALKSFGTNSNNNRFRSDNANRGPWGFNRRNANNNDQNNSNNRGSWNFNRNNNFNQGNASQNNGSNQETFNRRREFNRNNWGRNQNQTNSSWNNEQNKNREATRNFQNTGIRNQIDQRRRDNEANQRVSNAQQTEQAEQTELGALEYLINRYNNSAKGETGNNSEN